MDLEDKRALAKDLGARIRAALEGSGEVARRLAAIEAVRAKCRRVVALAEGAAGIEPGDFPAFVEASLLVAEAHARTGAPQEALAWFDQSDAAMEKLGVARTAVGVDVTTEAGLRGASLQAAGKTAEALPWLARFANRGWQSVLRSNADDHFLGLAADVLELAEKLGAAHGLDPAVFVAGSAEVALRRFSDNRMDEVVQWIERSEEARGEAGLPLQGRGAYLADLAYFAGHELRTKGQDAAALGIWSRAAAIYEQRGELDADMRVKLGSIYSALGFYLFERADAELKKCLAEKPPRREAIAELLAEPIRLRRRAVEQLRAVLEERPEQSETLAFYSATLAFLLEPAGQVEEALQCHESILALPAQGPGAVAPEQIVRAWLGRATNLHQLGRKDEAMSSFRTAQELVEGCPEETRALLRLQVSLTEEAFSQASG